MKKITKLGCNENILHCKDIDMIYLHDRKSYLSIPSSVINYLLFFSKNISFLEKLYYFLADLYAKLNESMNSLRETEKSALQWANLLGCSEGYIFKMQKNLEDAGYFNIIREIDQDNQNEKNIIIPTLPEDVFQELDQEPNRKGAEHLVAKQEPHQGYKRSHLDNSKMFISFNLQMIKLLLTDPSLSSFQKLFWLHAFCRSHISHIDLNGEGTRNFITNYQELALLFNCSEKNISNAINVLEKNGYLAKKQFYIKKEGSIGRRKKKSCWELSALFPKEQMEVLLKQSDRQNLAPLTIDDLRSYGLDTKIQHQPNSSASHNSSPILGASSYSSEYNNKYNILNTKNIVTEISDTTNIKSIQNDFNVFIENKLILSNEELKLGINLAAQFEEKTFLNPEKELTNLEETIKQVDSTLTNEEHWLVTKTAFTLHQKLQTEIQVQSANIANPSENFIIKLKETLFNPIEERLISLWESFSDLPNKAEQEEFLIRKSWLLKLLPPIKPTINLNPKLNQLEPTIMLQEEEFNIPALPGDKADKAQKFAKKLRNKGLAKGYAANISTEDLAREFMYHAATWIPEKLHCNTREAQIDAALSFAWKAAELGTWKCPYKLLNAQIAQREANAASWKN